LSTDQRLLASVAGLVLASLLAACDDVPQKESVGEYAVGPGDSYVAFGDSYTSAPGTGDRSDSAPLPCRQTNVNYPHRIAEATGVELVDNSCNGAETKNVVRPQRTPKGLDINRPQLAELDEQTDLVTFRLGANDYGLILRIFGCAIGFARGLVEDEPHVCRDLDREADDGGAAELMDDVAANVEDALETIRRRAPDALIIVIGYPQILPPEGSCKLMPLPDGDDAWARRIIDGFNDALREGAASVDASYVDMFEASAGHDTCADDPWMAGITALDGKAVPWHPYPKEAEVVTRLVLDELRTEGS
jgi:hypothetical protein